MAEKHSLPPISRRSILLGGAASVPVIFGTVGKPQNAHATVAPSGALLIQPDEKRQVIQGFGGMNHTRWMLSDLTNDQRNTAFGNGANDLGLSILRIPVPELRSNWTLDLATAQKAASKGALVFASPWNPPAELVEVFDRNVPPNGSKYQAEAGTLVDAHIENVNPGFEGNGYTVFDSATGASVQFNNVLIGSAGKKNLAFRYSAPHGNTTADVYVAGTLVASNVPFTATEPGKWTWKSIQADMVPGHWPVKVVTTGAGGPALDYLMAAAYTPPREARRLRHDSYGAYAKHLNDFVHFMRDNGVNLYAISVQNEPDLANEWTWWTTDEIIRFLRDFAPQIDCRIIAPESFQYRKEMSDPILQDPAALANMDILGAHLYGTPIPDFPYPLFKEKGAGKELWMTEVYHPNSSSSGNLWPEALKSAVHIHRALAEAEFQAYVWWYIRRSYGLILEDGTISKRGYMMAHFTKFIRRGSIRIEAPKEALAGVFTSAYLGEDGKVTVVAINTTTAAVSQPITVQDKAVGRVQSWVTDATRNLEMQPAAFGSGSSFTATLPPESATTFVLPF